MRLRRGIFTFVPRPRRRGAEYTGCAAIMRRSWRCEITAHSDSRLRLSRQAQRAVKIKPEQQPRRLFLHESFARRRSWPFDGVDCSVESALQRGGVEAEELAPPPQTLGALLRDAGKAVLPQYGSHV